MGETGLKTSIVRFLCLAKDDKHYLGALVLGHLSLLRLAYPRVDETNYGLSYTLSSTSLGCLDIETNAIKGVLCFIW